MITLANLKKMPKSCRECPFFVRYDHDENIGDGYCKLLGCTMKYASRLTRSYDCPLREVKEPLLTDEEILDAIFCDFCDHIDGGESNLRGVNNIEFTTQLFNHDMNSPIRISFTDRSSLVYCRNSNEV